MKHGVIMVVSLILTLCLMGVVSANDDIAVNCDDAQTQVLEEYITIESIEINDLEDYSSDINEEIEYSQNYNIYSENSNDLDDLNSLNSPFKLENKHIFNNLDNFKNLNALNNQEDLSINFESVEISGLNISKSL